MEPRHRRQSHRPVFVRARPLEHRRDLRFVRHVGAVDDRATAAPGRDGIGRGLRFRFVPGEIDHDVRAGVPERDGDRFADAGTRAGDNRFLPREQPARRHRWQVDIGKASLILRRVGRGGRGGRRSRVGVGHDKGKVPRDAGFVESAGRRGEKRQERLRSERVR